VENGLAQGKWLLYLTDPVELSPPGIGHCFLSPRHVNFLGLRKRTEAPPARQEAPPTKEEATSSVEAATLINEAAWPPSAAGAFPSSANSFTSYSSKDDLLSSNNGGDKFFSSKSMEISSSSYSSSSRTSWLDRRVVASQRRKEEEESVEGVYSARVRRATEHVVEPDHVLDSEGRVARVVVFDCGRETAKCLTISCSIPALPRGSHAIVRLR
jgi:hypothetical protein